jgi:CspA family cold shock protein
MAVHQLPAFILASIDAGSIRAMVDARRVLWRRSAWSIPFSNGPCVLALPVREVLEVVMTTGTIKKVVADRGFGFIVAEDAKEYFFHRGGLDSSIDFDRLVGGERVAFEIETSPKGPRATQVRSA